MQLQKLLEIKVMVIVKVILIDVIIYHFINMPSKLYIIHYNRMKFIHLLNMLMKFIHFLSAANNCRWLQITSNFFLFHQPFVFILGSNFSLQSSVKKIFVTEYPFETLCWVNKCENFWPYKMFSSYKLSQSIQDKIFLAVTESQFIVLN